MEYDDDVARDGSALQGFHYISTQAESTTSVLSDEEDVEKLYQLDTYSDDEDDVDGIAGQCKIGYPLVQV